MLSFALFCPLRAATGLPPDRAFLPTFDNVDRFEPPDGGADDAGGWAYRHDRQPPRLPAPFPQWTGA